MSSLQTRRELFELVSNLELSKNKREEYLQYLFDQHPLMNEEYVEVRDNYHNGEFRDSRIICVDESYPLKSFFKGKEGVNIFYNKRGCFEDYILEDLPEYFSPRKGLSALRVVNGNKMVLLPRVSFQPSIDILIQTEAFSLYEMLCIFIAGIRLTEKHFLSKKEFTNDSEKLLYLLYKPKESFFDITGEHIYCHPRENGKFIQEFSLYYMPEKKAWGVNFYNGGD